MHEIKFRVWDKDWKKFYFGKLLKNGFITTINPNAPCGKLSDWQQFTGLKDKNGKDIYDGDLLKIESGGISEVFWDRYYWAIANEVGVGGLGIKASSVTEVIGNIYENKDLL